MDVSRLEPVYVASPNPSPHPSQREMTNPSSRRPPTALHPVRLNLPDSFKPRPPLLPTALVNSPLNQKVALDSNPEKNRAQELDEALSWSALENALRPVGCIWKGCEINLASVNLLIRVSSILLPSIALEC